MFVCKCSAEKTFYLFNAFREQKTLGWPRNKNKDIFKEHLSGVFVSFYIFHTLWLEYTSSQKVVSIQYERV